ncbi:MAG: hypothetical protein K0R87_3532 [Pseudonocardia sp.]|jgi:hypothetical protein|nr:hypothetical protein [Pseudonocardia sp.]
MTDARERRIATLTAAAKVKSQTKTDAAEQAIRRLVKRGEPITFQAIGREAGVSHAFLYGHPDLRGRIDRLRAQNRPNQAEPAPAATESTLVSTLTSQVNNLKKQHRRQVQALQAALERAHGENLDLRRELARRGWPGQPAAPANHAASIATT